MLPEVLGQPLRDHLQRIRDQHKADRKRVLGRAPRPNALTRKYPDANRECGWEWLPQGTGVSVFGSQHLGQNTNPLAISIPLRRLPQEVTLSQLSPIFPACAQFFPC